MPLTVRTGHGSGSDFETGVSGSSNVALCVFLEALDRAASSDRRRPFLYSALQPGHAGAVLGRERDARDADVRSFSFFSGQPSTLHCLLISWADVLLVCPAFICFFDITFRHFERSGIVGPYLTSVKM